MKEVKNRLPLGNGKNNIIKPAAIPGTITTVAGLIAFLNAGFFADVSPNNATSGADVGTSEVGTPSDKSLFDSIDEGVVAWPGLNELDIQTGTVLLSSGWTYVPFTRSFRTIPVVNVTSFSSTSCYIKDTSVSGFYCSGGANTINWIAVVNNNLEA